MKFWLEMLDLLLCLTVMLGLGMVILNGRQILEAFVDWMEDIRRRTKRKGK